MSVRVGVELRADGSRLRSDMQAAMSNIKSYIASAFSIGAAIQGLKAIRDFVNEIKDTADSVGMSAEALQELNYAFVQSGVSAKDFVTAIRTLASIRERALAGDEKAVALMAKYGVGMLQLKAMNTDELFMATARAVNEMSDGMSRAAAATELWGRAGMKLIPALNNLQKARNDAREQGIISNEDLERLDKANDAIDRFVLRLKTWATLKAGGLLTVGEMGLSQSEVRSVEKATTVAGTAGGTLFGMLKSYSQIPIIGKLSGADYVVRSIEEGIDYKLKQKQSGEPKKQEEKPSVRKPTREDFIAALGLIDKVNGMIQFWSKPVKFAGSNTEKAAKAASDRVHESRLALTRLQQAGAWVSSPVKEEVPILRAQLLTQKQMLDTLKWFYRGIGFKV